jgi:hypothetical protein
VTKGRIVPNETSEKAPLAASPAAAFRRRSTEGELYELPGCGLVARLARPGLMGLVGAGATANPVLSPELLRMMSLDKTPASDEERLEKFERDVRAYREVAARCFVEPRLVLDREPNYDAGEIGPADIADRDYVWLYWTFSQGGDAQVAAFRLAGGSGGA